MKEIGPRGVRQKFVYVDLALTFHTRKSKEFTSTYIKITAILILVNLQRNKIVYHSNNISNIFTHIALYTQSIYLNKCNSRLHHSSFFRFEGEVEFVKFVKS